MNFSDKLNSYLEMLSCSAKELGALSGISAATLSRYRNGERVPELGTKPFDELCRAIAKIAAERNITYITPDSVKEDFIGCRDFVAADRETLRQNFNMLISALNINISRLCQYTNYDPSAIFRIRNGTRRPGDSEQFASAVASFVSREMCTQKEISALAGLLCCDPDKLLDLSVRYTMLKGWLLEQSGAGESGNDSVSEFLSKLDEFDLNEYIKVIRFDELKVPTIPFQLPSSKSYFGLKEMMESELDFLKATVLSKSNAPVTMYSDMPMKEMAKDPEFPKKWMFGMAMMLKKGLHLNQIHNLDRSFDEMMLGLESWIPMYMTGQISPYYFKSTQNSCFLHLLKVSGAAALSGEAIAGYHSGGRYYLTKSKREVEYYQKQAERMLENAYPLMEIYRSERENELNTFLLSDASKPGSRRSILSTLPLYTMSNGLLEKILEQNGIGVGQRTEIKKYAAAQKRRTLLILESETIEDEVPTFTAKEFENRPPVLELSGAFLEKDIFYSNETYKEHLKEIEAFEKEHPNYSLKQGSSHTFCNLQILIHSGQWVMVSKGKAPAIHFVIRHPKLRSAIESFIPPIVENE